MKKYIYACPACLWTSKVRFNKEKKEMICDHCGYKGKKEEFENEIDGEEEKVNI